MLEVWKSSSSIPRTRTSQRERGGRCRRRSSSAALVAHRRHMHGQLLQGPAVGLGDELPGGGDVRLGEEHAAQPDGLRPQIARRLGQAVQLLDALHKVAHPLVRGHVLGHRVVAEPGGRHAFALHQGGDQLPRVVVLLLLVSARGQQLVEVTADFGEQPGAQVDFALEEPEQRVLDVGGRPLRLVDLL
jgi:hypothetical protein